MRCLVVTGMSGAGKTTAIHVLEDMGYFCADNVPLPLVGEFFKLCRNSKNETEKFAAVIDIRSIFAFSFDIDVFKEKTKASKPGAKLLYIDASDDVLINRYKETRRRHPLMDSQSDITLEEAIKRERSTLAPLREIADYVVDTSEIKTGDFKDRLSQFLSLDKKEKMTVYLMSFGFKNSVPRDADLVFDVRCLPNPFYIKELRHKTGLSDDVYNYVFSFPQSEEFYKKIKDLIEYSLPLYEKEGKSRVVIAFGCTGGQHRSVSFARRLYNDIKDDYLTIYNHRDISK